MQENLITYSKSIVIPITRACKNICGYCAYRKDEYSLQVPYHNIKICKEARDKGCREALFTAGERPDRYSSIRSTLDLWGFSSYIEYIATVCEISFLENLLPVVDIGYLTLQELKVIRRISVALRIMLESADKSLIKKEAHKLAKGKAIEKRIEVISNAGILKFPVTTGILVGIGESENSYKESFAIIKDLHNQYGNIQNVVIQDFVPEKGTPMQDFKPPSTEKMLKTVSLAREILPDDVAITVHPKRKHKIIDFIKAGANDLGSLSQVYWQSIDNIKETLEENGYQLHKRLPIFEKYILDKWYSRKTGQIMDRYRVMLKQEIEKKHNQLLEEEALAMQEEEPFSEET